MPSTPRRLVRVSLKGLFPDATIVGADDVWVKACRASSDLCRPGELFVAIDESTRDGHHDAHDAVGRGAVAVLSERLLPISVPQCVVPNSRRAYGRLCQALAGFPAQQLRTVGVTGTHGKTTVQWLLASILEQAGWQTGVWGSLGRFDGATADPCPIDVASSRGVARWLQRTHQHGSGCAVIEASSQALASDLLAATEFDVAVVTNCLHDHLPQHGTRENYLAAKQRIFQHLKPQGAIVLNHDCPVARRWATSLDQPVLTFGLREGANVTGEIVAAMPGEQSVLLHLGDETFALQSRLVGEHQLQNCLAAAAAGLVLGVPSQQIVSGLETMDVVPGRLERVGDLAGPAVYLDEARTPAALALVLSAVRRVTSGRVFVVYGAGYLPSVERARLGRVGERFADVTVLSSHRLNRTAPLRVIHDMLDGFQRPARAQVMPDRAKAICWALSQATTADSVVLVGPQRGNLPQSKARDVDVVQAWTEAYAAAARR